MAGKIFLGGISPNTTTEAIESHFSRYGNVIDAVVMYKDGKHRGFGFVTFDNPACVSAVLAEEQVIDGRTVDAKPAVPQGEAPPPRSNGVAERLPSRHQPIPAYGGSGGGRGYGAPPGVPPAAPASSPVCDKVFVGGLAQTTTDDMVRDYFSQYGSIIDCVVMKDRGSMRSRGFGFVQFDCPEPVDEIIADYSNHHIDGKWIEVKKAIPQDQMPPAICPGPPPPSRGGGYGGYSGGGHGCKGGYGGPPVRAGRAPHTGPPPAYPSYGPPPPHYGMVGYSPYGGYPAYHGGAYASPGRTAYRQRPY